MMNGGNILVLQRILGHANIRETMRYAHFAPDHLEDAVTLNPLAYHEASNLDQAIDFARGEVEYIEVQLPSVPSVLNALSGVFVAHIRRGKQVTAVMLNDKTKNVDDSFFSLDKLAEKLMGVKRIEING